MTDYNYCNCCSGGGLIGSTCQNCGATISPVYIIDDNGNFVVATDDRGLLL